MTNTQYIEKIFSSVERILVDTSALMTQGFQQFIGNNKDRLISGRKKIVVPKAVYTELARHMESSDSTKSELAMAVVELMALNKDIFQVECVPLTEEEIAHTFADAQLLSDLIVHRSDCSQLLITNDRKLSCDAFELNQQQSCKGRKVLVCYITWNGKLQCCECARSSLTKTYEEPITDAIVSEPASDEIPISIVEEQTSGWKFDGLSCLLGLSSAIFLYGLYKGGKVLLRNVA